MPFNLNKNSAQFNTPLSNQAFSVSELNHLIADLLSANLPAFLWVEGEISNLSLAPSGHRYLSLKDQQSTVRCALFKNTARNIAPDTLTPLANGDKVIVKARLAVYKLRGEYQLIIQDIEPAGFGVLAKAFIALKNKLDKAGLTATAKKRPLPSWPKKIALVTSPQGAAVRDVLATLARRAPFIAVDVFATPVQGSTAADAISAALALANASHAEVILLVRGGGSLEDLQAFNDEALAYQIADSRLPVITGIGHETDFTIADFVSDYRAPTPTAAAEVSSPDKIALHNRLLQYKQRLLRSQKNLLAGYQQALAHAIKRLMNQHPSHIIEHKNQQLDEKNQRLVTAMQISNKRRRAELLQQYKLLHVLSPFQQLMQGKQHMASLRKQLQRAINHQLEQQQRLCHSYQQRLSMTAMRYPHENTRLQALADKLQLLSPLGLLDRGYTLVFDDRQQLIKSASQIALAQNINIRLSDSTVHATVDKITKKH